MASVAALELDLRRRAPSAPDLFAAAEAGTAGTTPAGGPWDSAEWSLSQATELKGLSALMQLWKPWFESGRHPGDELRASLLERWPSGSYEKEMLMEALAEADALEHSLLVRHEIKNLDAEAATTQSDASRLYEVLQACLQDLKRVDPTRHSGFGVHPDSLALSQWTMHNLICFLQAHWALRKTHLAVKALTEARLAALDRIAGAFEGTADMSSRHDDID